MRQVDFIAVHAPLAENSAPAASLAENSALASAIGSKGISISSIGLWSFLIFTDVGLHDSGAQVNSNHATIY